jgi:hypothetical protein
MHVRQATKGIAGTAYAAGYQGRSSRCWMSACVAGSGQATWRTTESKHTLALVMIAVQAAARHISNACWWHGACTPMQKRGMHINAWRRGQVAL